MSQRKKKRNPMAANAAQRQAPSPASTPRTHEGRQKLPWVLASFLCLLGGLLYIHTIGHGYALDDNSVITDSHIVRGGVGNVGEVFATRYREGSFGESSTLYRPMSVAMFAVEWGVAPNTPQLSHAVNVLLYAATCGLLFLAFQRILHRYSIWIPFIATFLFAIHPVHTEIVANIKSRDELLVMFFALLALLQAWRYAQRNSVRHLAASGLALTAALFSKENAMNFVVIIPLTLYFFSGASVSKILTSAAAYAGAAAIYLAARVAVLGSIVHQKSHSVAKIDNFLAAADLGFWEQKASAVWILGKYLSLLVFPSPLICDYNYNHIPTTTLSDPLVILSLLIHAGCALFAFRKLKSKHLLSYAILFYLLNMFLYSNLALTIGAALGERFLYISSFGFCLAVAYGLAHFLGDGVKALPEMPKDIEELIRGKVALIAILALALLVWGFLTAQRAAEWKDSYTLYSADLHKAPGSARLNGYIGTEYLKLGREAKDPAEAQEYFKKAEEVYIRSLEILPSYTEARGQLGMTYYRQKKFAEAAKHYETAIRDPKCKGSIYSNFGTMYFEDGMAKKAQGDEAGFQFALGKAREYFTEALRREPNYTDGYLNLGSSLGALGDHQKAIAQFRKAIPYAKPEQLPSIYRNMAVAFRSMGNEAKAQEMERKAGQ